MRPPAPIQKLEVYEYWLAVSGRSSDEALLHPIEEQRLITVVTHSKSYRFTRSRWNKQLRLDASGEDLRNLGHLGRKHALLDQIDVTIKARTLVPSDDLGDDAI